MDAGTIGGFGGLLFEGGFGGCGDIVGGAVAVDTIGAKRVSSHGPFLRLWWLCGGRDCPAAPRPPRCGSGEWAVNRAALAPVRRELSTIPAILLGAFRPLWLRRRR